jgi:beta-galactosidase
LVEAMGHVKIGRGLYDRKGLSAPVLLAGHPAPLKNWEVYSFPLDEAERAKLRFHPGPATGPAFWRGHFQLKATGDTFLDLRLWGHGAVWINGHGLGRFWNIGPTQTMYCPAPWLKVGENEVVVLELIGPRAPALAGLNQPILGELHPELDFAR